MSVKRYDQNHDLEVNMQVYTENSRNDHTSYDGRQDRMNKQDTMKGNIQIDRKTKVQPSYAVRYRGVQNIGVPTLIRG